jgi:hypothetical protein
MTAESGPSSATVALAHGASDFASVFASVFAPDFAPIFHQTLMLII